MDTLSPDSWDDDREEILLDDDLLPEDLEIEPSEEDLDSDSQLFPLADSPGDDFASVPLPPSSSTPRSPKPLAARRRSPDDDPTTRFLDFHKHFKRLRVDWSKEKPYRILSSLRRRAALLGWTQEDLLAVEESMNIYSTVPRRCPGHGEFNAEGEIVIPPCPCKALYGANPSVWKGQACPQEIVRMFKLFIQYVRSLEIEPDDHVDLQMVGDIIRLHILEERCDIPLQTGQVAENVFGGIHNKSHTVYFNRVASSPITTQKLLREQRLDIYKRLCADRTSRRDTEFKSRKLQADQKTAQAAVDMVQYMAQVNKPNLVDRQKRLIHDARKPAVEAVYKDETHDSENQNPQDDGT